MRWRECTIGDFVDARLASIQTGPFGTQLKAADYTSDGTPVINVRNIGFGSLNPEKLEFINGETTDRLSVHLLQRNDIVFGRKGAVERHLYVTEEQERWLQGSDCIRLRFSTAEVCSRFISYAFLTTQHRQWMLIQASNKATMASLNQDIIKRIPLLLPPLPVQYEIACILCAYDDLIENNLRRIALLEESARLLYREWFVRLRFPGHEHTRIVDGVPEGWERRTLGECFTLKRGHDLPETHRVPGNIPVISSSGVTGYHNEKKANGPGIVTGRYGTLGDVYYVEQDYWPHNTALYVMDFKGNSARVVYFFLKHALQKAQSNNAAVPGLNRNVIHTFSVVWPSNCFRERFDEFVKPIFDQLATLRLMNDRLRAARDLLLPRLMRGEIAV